jgi:hypothetical protein
MSPYRLKQIALVLLLATVAALSACNEYYIPPPDIVVTVSGNQKVAPLVPQACTILPCLIIAGVDANGHQFKGTYQFQATVENATVTPAVTWYVSNGGPLVRGGNDVLGTIDSTGKYTAPAALPTPNELLITAVSVEDPNQKSNASFTIYNPAPVLSSIAILPATGAAGSKPLPAAVSGNSYVLRATGDFFFPDTQVTLSSGTVNAPIALAPVDTGAGDFAPTSFSVPVTMQNPGALQFAVLNSRTYVSLAAPAPFQLIAEPATAPGSSAIANLVEQVGTSTVNGTTSPVYSDVAFVPDPTLGFIAVVAADLNKEISHIVLPFAATAVAADPINDTIVAVGANSTSVALVDASAGSVLKTFTVPATGTATFGDETCTVCGVLVDANRNRAIVDAANGFFLLDLSSGAVSGPFGAAVENFTYDPEVQRIYAPLNGVAGAPGTLQIVDIPSSSILTWSEPSLPGAGQLTAAAFDAATQYLMIPDTGLNQILGLNLNSELQTGSLLSIPSDSFVLAADPESAAEAAACPGTWNSAALEPGTHMGVFSNAGGACVSVAQLTGNAISGAPGPPLPFRWAALGAGPDGVVWANAPGPHWLATFTGEDGKPYGLALRADGKMVLKLSLEGLMVAVVPTGGADTTQADPTLAATYIPIS